jgi:uncharacterized protein (TIGR02246 family)
MHMKSFAGLWLTLSLATSAGATDQPRGAVRARDEAALRKIIDDQNEAWRRHDAAAWSKDFAEDVDTVTVTGKRLSDRAGVEQNIAALFNGPFKHASNVETVRELVFVTRDVAILDTDQEVTGYDALPPGVQPTDPVTGKLVVRMKYVCRKDNGAWKIVSAQNTDVKPPPPAAPARSP